MSVKNKFAHNYHELLADPGNAIVFNGRLITRKKIAESLGTTFKNLYKHFTAAEMDEIERNALAERRRRCSRESFAVDQALFKRAKAGDVSAMKLFYERIEGWSPQMRLGIEPAVEDLREIAVAKGYDPDEYVALYNEIRARNIRKGKGK